MPSIRIMRFAGLLPEVNPQALREDHAQIAHNALLWDGWLRAMPEWKFFYTFAVQPQSLIYSVGYTGQFLQEATMFDAQTIYQEPFAPGTVFGILGSALNYRTPGNLQTNTLLPRGEQLVTSVAQSVTAQNKSVYPISRTYAITFMAGNVESSPFIFPQLGGDGTLFEGDVVTLTINTTLPASAAITGARLYRTVPG